MGKDKKGNIIYDESSRLEFITGFKKRKDLRRQKAKELQENLEKKNKLEIRQEKLKEKKLAKQRVHIPAHLASYLGVGIVPVGQETPAKKESVIEDQGKKIDHRGKKVSILVEDIDLKSHVVNVKDFKMKEKERRRPDKGMGNVGKPEKKKHSSKKSSKKRKKTKKK
ncbi:Nucleolar protein 12 like protein [Aduncisulcus paluster]|uniref:Nucleolar protein 12 like protein n=1 Tax=Aduncisulcus paluster TaxID=2918883 RepID=A0ABQ5KT86_9EUKA|nr:Nucleolar protein 12 like protein [Aduncisulcus paluster]